jgi:hypothetical protein
MGNFYRNKISMIFLHRRLGCCPAARLVCAQWGRVHLGLSRPLCAPFLLMSGGSVAAELQVRMRLVLEFFHEKCDTSGNFDVQFFRRKVTTVGVVMTRKMIVVTNCTNRKRVGGDAVTLSIDNMSGSLPAVAARWGKAIRKTCPSRQAQDIYMGRAFSEARHVTAMLGGTLHIISAGLGVVGAEDKIPLYNLTVADGANSLKPLLTQLGKRPSDWWAALTAELGEQRSVRALLENNPDVLALFALPGSYIALVAEDLASLTSDQLDRVRIITSDHGKSLLAEKVRPAVLPYDERLEGSSYAGTRTDFPQRALRHFVEALSGHQLSTDDAKESVKAAMLAFKKPVTPLRERKTDSEILMLLSKNWKRFDGASAQLLRYLRDEALVACEQSRFRNLWNHLRQDLTTKG